MTCISGSLFPAQYVADRLVDDAGVDARGVELDRTRRRLATWWRGVEASCGPASGLRLLIDQVAMPLFGALGYVARDLEIGRSTSHGILETRGGARVPFLVLPWSERPASLWRDVSTLARHAGARWCFVLSPPFLSLVEARGCAVRRSADVLLPHATVDPGFRQLLAIASADLFEPTRGAGARMDALVERAARHQDRVRTDLQVGVFAAKRSLVTAITASAHATRHPQGSPTGQQGTPPDEQALTVIYRILFLLFAESRGLAMLGTAPAAREYSVSALCREALGTEPRYGLWDSLAAITRLARAGSNADELEASPFNGRLFARVSAPALEHHTRARRASTESASPERAAREALVALGSRAGRAGRESIQYRDLGVEELGAVYERLLDVDPAEIAQCAPGRTSAHSPGRKRSGTFYTPRPLADFVVRRTLAPLVEQASSDGILALRVVDPAMGSGAFLVAACRFLADAYARALIDEGRLSATDLDDHRRAAIRRLIAERCLAGVDRNPVAVQLARLSLWLTTLAGGKPLSFLDHRLRIGDSLIGGEPSVLAHIRPPSRGRPDGRRPLFDAAEVDDAMHEGASAVLKLIALPADTLRDVRTKEALWKRAVSERSALAPWRHALSLWCAQWFWPEHAAPPSTAELRALIDGLLHADRTLTGAHVRQRLATVADAAASHAFFHWPLEFPDVFSDGPGTRPPGFDAVIGNPPWEMLRREGVETEDRQRRGLVRFVRESRLYPCCDRGHMNLYQPFIDRALSLTRPGGYVGLVLPWGLAADDGAASLRSRLLDTTSIHTVVGLDNAAGMFPIHRGLRFLVVVSRTDGKTESLRARFGVTTSAELDDLPDRDEPADRTHAPLVLTRSHLQRIGGAARRLPDLRRPHELSFLEAVAARFPALGTAASWNARFGRELNATDARVHFSARGLPVLEGKHIRPYRTVGASAWRIERSRALKLLPDARFDRPRLGYRDIAGVANSRSLIACIVAPAVVTTHTILCMRTETTDAQRHFLCGLFNSYVLNSVARLLMGSHLTTSLIEGLPVPPWTGDPQQQTIGLMAQQLALTPDDRAVEAELEAQVARLYEIDEATFAALLAGFPLVPDRDRAAALAAWRRASRNLATEP